MRAHWGVLQFYVDKNEDIKKIYFGNKGTHRVQTSHSGIEKFRMMLSLNCNDNSEFSLRFLKR